MENLNKIFKALFISIVINLSIGILLCVFFETIPEVVLYIYYSLCFGISISINDLIVNKK